jgi:putative ABC transport system permease protein
MLTDLRHRLRALLVRNTVEDEIDAELRCHFDRLVEKYEQAGLDRAEAGRRARLQFGGLDQVKDEYRDALGTRSVDECWRDLRYGVRSLWRAPRFTFLALTLLVLSIGAATAIFSVAYTVLVRPLPYPDAERLVFLAESGGSGIAWPNFEDWRRRATSFEGLACSLGDALNLTGRGTPRRLETRSVSSNFFTVVGIQPHRGRLFEENDARPSEPAAVVISHALWVGEFGATTSIVGQSISLNDRPYAVIGILPPAFRFMAPADIYLLLEPRIAANFRGMQNRNTHTNLFGVGRLKPQVSMSAAQAEMRAIAAALALEHPATNKGRDVHLVQLADSIVSEVAPTLTVLAGAVMLLLLISWVNLANLLLVRSAARAHEFSVRAALGASRWRLVRQLLVEQALLVITGGVVGAVVGAAMLTSLITLAPRNLPRLDEVSLDWAVLLGTAGMSCVCAFLFGVIPALRASGIRGQEAVIRAARDGMPSTFRLRRALTVAEIAVATILLVGSGLMVHTMLRLTRVDLGFDTRNLQTFMFAFQGPGWPTPRKQAFYDAVVERIQAVPGVENVGITNSLPILGSSWNSTFLIADRPAPDNVGFAAMTAVTAGYFETLKVPLIRGRFFERSDRPDSFPVAVINDSLARQLWPGQDPIGKRIGPGLPIEPVGPWRTIVGVVGDIKQNGFDQEPPRQVFLPIVQQIRSTVFVVVRTQRPQDRSAIEAAFHALDSSMPLFNERTLDQVISEALSRRQLAMVLLSVFAAVAVFLAAIGLYGVIAQSVAERRKEIGVRMALGAKPGQVLWNFLRDGLIVTGVGIACGVIASMAISRSLASLVYGVTTTDPATLAAVTVLLAGISLAACYVPARAATRLDPLLALRVE